MDINNYLLSFIKSKSYYRYLTNSPLNWKDTEQGESYWYDLNKKWGTLCYKNNWN